MDCLLFRINTLTDSLDRIIINSRMSLQQLPQQGFIVNRSLHKKNLIQNTLDNNSIQAPPPLKWAGGKRWFLPHIRPYWERYSHLRLTELFCGGLAVALGLNLKKALLNDINQPLIHFFKILKKGFFISSPLKNSEEYYYQSRGRFNNLLKKDPSSTKLAELFYYLNRTGYNGLCRFNSQGEFNVPFGKYKVINYRKDFSVYKQLFKHWTFSCKDFEKLNFRPEDFIYADPPYDVEFTKYSKQDFSFSDQIRLAEFLAKHKGPVILSNQATPRIIKLYKNCGFKLQFLDAPRRISCTGDRTPAKEVMALHNI